VCRPVCKTLQSLNSDHLKIVCGVQVFRHQRFVLIQGHALTVRPLASTV
jgi:hypothetical protein